MDDRFDEWLSQSLTQETDAASDEAFAARTARRLGHERRMRIVRRFAVVVGVTLLAGALGTLGLAAVAANGQPTSMAGWLPYGIVGALAALLFREALLKLDGG